jgi:hypothetical protein
MSILEEFFNATIGARSPAARVRLVGTRRTNELLRRKRNESVWTTIAENATPLKGSALHRFLINQHVVIDSQDRYAHPLKPPSQSTQRIRSG